MTRPATIWISFFAAAIPCAIFIVVANTIAAGPLYWPGVLVSLPALPLIIPLSLLFNERHTLIVYVCVPLVWGTMAAACAAMVTQPRRTLRRPFELTKELGRSR